MVEFVRIKSSFAAILMTYIFLGGCDVAKSDISTNVTKIVYHFRDSSVPPQYHRSYTITVTRDKIHVIVDSYGNVISDSEFEMPENKMNDLIKYIEIYQIRKKDYSENEICTGGTSKSITVFSGEDVVIEGITYKCGGSVYGSLSGDIDSFAKRIEGLIPDMDKLLQ